jgi:hypothetical protein
MEEKLDHHNVQIAQVRRSAFCFSPVGLIVHFSGHASKWVRGLGSDTTERDNRSNVMYPSTKPLDNTIQQLNIYSLTGSGPTFLSIL